MKQNLTNAVVWKHFLSLQSGNKQERERLAVGLVDNLTGRGLRVMVICDQGEEELTPFLSFVSQRGGDVHLCSQVNENGIDMPERQSLHKGIDGYDLVLYMPPLRADWEGDVVSLLNPWQVDEVLFTCHPGEEVAQLAERVLNWLAIQVMEQQVWGGVLIGGKSSRMGRPKHLIRDYQGITWVERIVGQLDKAVDRVVLVGKGDVPESLHHLDHLTDISEAKGPLAGILSAMRWQPMVSWLVAACDLPAITREGIDWLLGTRIPGVWGTVPRHPESGRLEPLLAYYDFRSRFLFENLLMQGELKPNLVCQSDKIVTPVLPLSMANCWLNCNTPDDLVALEKKHYHHT